MNYSLDEIIDICKKYLEIHKTACYGYGYGPESYIETCEKLKFMGLNWGDKLVISENFRLTKGKRIVHNSAYNYNFDKDTYYIEWDNGNVGRLQFVSDKYYYLVTDEWNEFKSKLISYNALDYDTCNCHIIYNIEDGKRVIADYANICKETKEKMNKKIALAQIEEKKAEITKLQNMLDNNS